MISPSDPRLLRRAGEHWRDLASSLPKEPSGAFSDWLDHELQRMEGNLADYVTRQSLRRELRR